MNNKLKVPYRYIPRRAMQVLSMIALPVVFAVMLVRGCGSLVIKEFEQVRIQAFKELWNEVGALYD